MRANNTLLEKKNESKNLSWQKWHSRKFEHKKLEIKVYQKSCYKELWLFSIFAT